MPKENAIFLQSVGTAFAATSQVIVFGTLALNIFMATSLQLIWKMLGAI